MSVDDRSDSDTGRAAVNMLTMTSSNHRSPSHLGFQTPPSVLPGGRNNGESVSHKSSRRRAYAQWIVITRLLYHLHDPAEQLSRMQRIYPHAWLNCNTLTSATDFHRDAVANLLRFRAKGLFVSEYDVWEKNHRVLAWILT